MGYAMAGIASISAIELLDLYRSREASAVQVMRDTLARIEKFNPVINAFVLVDADGAAAAAHESAARWEKGEPRGRLDGVPVTVKDNIDVKGWPTRKGSLTTDDTPAADDAPAVARLREEGAIILGKTAMPEYGWIGACHSPLSGITRNPSRLDRTTGGSSGGAAAAASLGLGLLHLGTDGAGSIRIPASFTGVFGFKPTFGRVPAYPASPFTVLAHQGPLTRNVADAALALSVIAQPDERDMTAWNTPAPDFCEDLDAGVEGLRIAWSPRLGYVRGLDPQVEDIAGRAAQTFGELGAVVEEADPVIADPREIIAPLWGAGCASIADAIPRASRALMDPDFLRMAEAGRLFSLNDYLVAYRRRAELHVAMMRFHSRYDLLLTPQMPVTAIEAGRVTPADGSFGENWLNWSPYTYPFNLTQQPAASVPCGHTTEGLPVGLQIVGPRRKDALVLRAARAFERVRPFGMLEEPRATAGGDDGAVRL
jgi:aspartyl-tRNA(Asn)/glutamyl-tRNA(Gln) amidotransferase subunit A